MESIFYTAYSVIQKNERYFFIFTLTKYITVPVFDAKKKITSGPTNHV